MNAFTTPRVHSARLGFAICTGNGSIAANPCSMPRCRPPSLRRLAAARASWIAMFYRIDTCISSHWLARLEQLAERGLGGRRGGRLPGGDSSPYDEDARRRALGVTRFP